jgi:hypothetical protein
MFMRRMTSDDHFGGGGADLQSLLEMGVDGEAELGQRVCILFSHMQFQTRNFEL